MVVVLPAPFGPRKACTSPAPTSRSSPSSARTLPYRLVSPAARIATPLIPSLYRAAGPVASAPIADIRYRSSTHLLATAVRPARIDLTSTNRPCDIERRPPARVKPVPARVARAAHGTHPYQGTEYHAT